MSRGCARAAKKYRVLNSECYLHLASFDRRKRNMKETTMTAPISQADLPCCACSDADPGRRLALKAVAGAALAAGTGLAWADDGPKAGDQLVQVDDEAKKPLGSADIKVGEKPVIVYPYDPKAKALRDSSRLNRIVLVKLDPSTLDAATAARAADGIV